MVGIKGRGKVVVILLLLFFIFSYIRVYPQQFGVGGGGVVSSASDLSCKIVSSDEKAEPVIKYDVKAKKWSFSLRLETRNCNDLEYIIDIYYEKVGNSILGQDYATNFKIVNNQIKVDFNFSGEETFVFPSDNYYYRIEINPELQNPSILQKRRLEHIVFEKKFSIGSPEEKEQYFIEYIDRFTALTNLANILFQKAIKSYFDKFMSIKSKFEKGVCEKYRKQKANWAQRKLGESMRGKVSEDTSFEDMEDNERKCKAWQNYVDVNWVSFEGQFEGGIEGGDGNTITLEGIDEKIEKVIEVDEQLLDLLNSAGILADITKDKKTVEWIYVYNGAREYVESLYSRKIILLPHIVQKISELYDKLRVFVVCLKDILKDGSEMEIRDWGNCPKDLKSGSIQFKKDEIANMFSVGYNNILQRIYEARYPQDVQKLRKDLTESIENLYKFFVQIQEIVRTRKPVPAPTTKNVEESYNSLKKYFSDLKEEYKKGPINAVYSEAFRLMRTDILENQDKLLDSFNSVFNQFVSNVKGFKGFPQTVNNYIKAVSDSFANLALQLKDSELNSLLKKSWERIAPEYEPKEIEKVEVAKTTHIYRVVFEKVKELVSGYSCTFKLIEDPENPKQTKRIDMDSLLSELTKNYSNNPKEVNTFISQQPYFNKIDDWNFLCARRLTLLWIKEIIHDDSFDPLLVDYLQKYKETILKLTPPLNSEQYMQVDSLVLDTAIIYDILTTKQNRGLLLNQTLYDIKKVTNELLGEMNKILTGFYEKIENELKPLFENATDAQKLGEISTLHTNKLSIEFKEGETMEDKNEPSVRARAVLERKDIRIPYIAILIKTFQYITETGDSEYLPVVLSFLDVKYLDNERREVVKTTIEKIGIEKYIPLQQFNDEYIVAIQNVNKEKDSIREKLEKLSSDIIKSAEKVNKNIKTFDEALQLASDNDKKTYEELRKESNRIAVKDAIFCLACEHLKKLKAKIEEKLNK